MALVYVAGALFARAEREWLERIDAWLVEAGHDTFLPHRDAGDTLGGRQKQPEARSRIFHKDREAVAACDAMIAVLDGPDVDSGTAVEMGIAHALGRPILGIRTDLRTLGPEGAVNLMVEGVCTRFLHVPEGDPSTVQQAVAEFAAGLPRKR